MTAVTIRNLDDQVKDRLRMRAVVHGRSMESEIRAILAEAVNGSTPTTRSPSPARATGRNSLRTTGLTRVTYSALAVKRVVNGGSGATEAQVRATVGGCATTRTNVRE